MRRRGRDRYKPAEARLMARYPLFHDCDAKFVKRIFSGTIPAKHLVVVHRLTGTSFTRRAQ